VTDIYIYMIYLCM